jgi:hypothetical protein
MADLNNGEGSSNCKRKTGPKFSPIWDHFVKGDSIGNGLYQATCKYCNQFFKQGRPNYLRTYILSFCTEAGEDVKQEVNKELLENESLQPSAKKIAIQGIHGQKQIDNYYNPTTIEAFQQKEIEQALVMMFICCGLSFRVVESPFFINLLKALHPGFVPPSRELLSGRLLDKEVARVNESIRRDLKDAENLTIGMNNKMNYNIFICIKTAINFLFNLFNIRS